MSINSNENRLETELSLQRVQNFVANDIVRRDDLGMYAFNETEEPAQRLIDLANTLPVSHLAYFPNQQLEAIKRAADGIYSTFQSFISFDLASAQPSVDIARANLVTKLENQYQHSFNELAPLISFATARSQDFSELEREARVVTQSAKDQATQLVNSLNEQKAVVDGIIAEVRTAAAEQGVSKQAIHFKTEADKHETQAGIWLERSVKTAIGLGAFAILSLFLHHFPGLDSNDPYRLAQIAVSKVLIFGVIAYMLALCAKNFLSHRHNQVVNRHRQNALATFTALVEATSDAASSDIVLSHAASCIFAPQETGYAKQDGAHSDGMPSLQILPRIQQAAG